MSLTIKEVAKNMSRALKELSKHGFSIEKKLTTAEKLCINALENRVKWHQEQIDLAEERIKSIEESNETPEEANQKG